MYERLHLLGVGDLGVHQVLRELVQQRRGRRNRRGRLEHAELDVVGAQRTPPRQQLQLRPTEEERVAHAAERVEVDQQHAIFAVNVDIENNYTFGNLIIRKSVVKQIENNMQGITDEFLFCFYN